nr:Integrase (XerC) [uncultured Mediterranean phage uvMED]
MIKTKIVPRGNKWVVQVADELNKYKQAGSFNTELEARNFKQELIDNKDKAVKSQNKITVVEAYKQYAIYKWELYNTYDQMSENQSKLYKRNFENWVDPYFPKNIQLRKLSNEDLKKFFMLVRLNGATHKTAAALIYSFKGMVKWCVMKDIILFADYNIEHFEIGKYPELKPKDNSDKAKKTVMINRYEVNQLSKAITPTDPNNYEQVINYVGINIFMYTGARPGEVRGIEWCNVNLKTSKIYISQQMQQQTLVHKVKAIGSERIIHMPSKLQKILARWKDYQSERVPNAKFVLQNVLTALPITDKQLRNFLYRGYEKIGLASLRDNGNHVKVLSCKFKGEPFKTFRHFAATALLDAQAGNPLLTDNFIKTQIGHRDIKTTRMIYGDHNDLDSQSNIDNQITNSLDKGLKLN